MQSHQLREIASWRIATEVVRQFPGTLRLYETHPGGGQYDCLSLHDHRGLHLADFNRHGRFHVFHKPNGESRNPEPWDIWRAMAETNDMKSILKQVDEMIGFTKPAKLPKSTPRTIVYRFIASFLSHAAFTPWQWRVVSGMCDTSGYGGGVHRDYFAKFPGTKTRLETPEKGDPLHQPAYRFWFLVEDDKPRLCLEDTGRAWKLGGKQSINLSTLYAKTRRIWPIVHQVAGDLLP
jgi:hypothetical protein